MTSRALLLILLLSPPMLLASVRALGSGSPIDCEKGYRPFASSEASALTYVGQSEKWHTLRFQQKDGNLVHIRTKSNYYLTPEGRVRPEFESLVRTILDDPQTQLKMNEILTNSHARHEMSFRVKNPLTQQYDAIFMVPVHSSVMPLNHRQFQETVASTEPVMRSLRDLLQKIYSTPPAELNAKTLGIEHLPKVDQDLLLEAVKSTIYFEPKMVTPAMREYPFLAVGGFDAPMGNLDGLSNVFFEFNLGTPSGLSNNIQLLEELRKSNPKVFNQIRARLPDFDRTFKILRETIEDNAAAWTGNRKGISVVIGPGVANGAHPDVASIAMFSGMPLVKPQDLYIDVKGAVRLNVGKGKDNPVVTGIYGRAEESFFLQSTKDGIPIRDPNHEDNVELGKRLGLDLEPGVVYQFKYAETPKKNAAGEILKDEAGNEILEKTIVGVETDAQGKPLLQPASDTIGADPTRPDAPRGSFADAIRDRKLYYSGFGGRVVDDKRVFQITSEHLAPGYVNRANPYFKGIAKPPRTLKLEEYPRFYETPVTDLGRFVVKVPNESGGVGVYLMINLPESERRRVVELVKKNPTHFIIQEFADYSAMLSVKAGADGKPEILPLANDTRIFVMMDSKGNVRAGENSMLVRVAKEFSSSTNTSQGASYGVMAVMEEPRAGLQPIRRDGSILPKPAPHAFIGVTRRYDLHRFFRLFNTVVNKAEAGIRPKDYELDQLPDLQRDVMDLLGRDYSPLMQATRDYKAGQMSLDDYRDLVTQARARMLKETDFPAQGVAEEARQALRPSNALPVKVRETEFKTQALAQPELVRYDTVNGQKLVKYETDRYVPGKHPGVNKVLRELESEGGALRDIRTQDQDTGEWISLIPAPYFRVTDEGKPIIGINMRQDSSPDALAHEYEHYLLWKEIRDRYRRDHGLSLKEAGQRAGEDVFESELWVESERLAVGAEVRSQIRDQSILNRGGNARPIKYYEEGFITRFLYPRTEGIRNEIYLATHVGEKKPKPGLAEKLIRESIEVALRLRKKAYSYQLGRAQALMQEGTPEAAAEAARLLGQASWTRNREIFDDIFPPQTIQLFENQNTTEKLYEVYSQVYRQVLDDPRIQPLLLGQEDPAITAGKISTSGGSKRQQ